MQRLFFRYLAWTRLAAFFLGLWAASAHAQQEAALFEVRGPRREVTEGARFEVSFVLKNETAQRFIPPDFGGLSVRQGPTEVRSAGFFNGKPYSQQSWVYELEASHTGSYTIGPATAQTARQNLRSQPLTIRVVKSTARRPSTKSGEGEERYFIAADVHPKNPWLGQQMFYSLRLYTQLSVSDADLLELPSFEGFYAQERHRYDARVHTERVGGKTYMVRTLHEVSLFAQRTGTLTIGPARVRLVIDEGTRRLLGGTSAIVVAPAVPVEVRPLPEPQPERFCGGVGTYEWTVSTDKQALTTDDVLTLKVRIRGNGDARRFVPPRFLLPAALEAFDPEVREQEEYETGDEFIHQRTLTYAILPKQPGSYLFTPEMTFFNPDSEQYQTLRTEKPIEIAVVPGANYGKPLPASDTLGLPLPPEPEVWWEALDHVPEPWVFGMAGIAALFFLGWLAALIWQRQRRKLRAEEPRLADVTPALPDRRHLHHQLQQLRRDLPDLPPEVFYRDLLKWIENAVAAYLRLPPSLLSRESALAALTARGLPAPAVEALADAWERCERAVYAHIAPPADMEACWEKAHFGWRSLSGKG